jgi:hypothetical protein
MDAAGTGLESGAEPIRDCILGWNLGGKQRQKRENQSVFGGEQRGIYPRLETAFTQKT